MSFFAEFWAFLKTRKKLWLLPFVMVIGILVLLVIFTSQSAVAPFIYTLF